MKNHIVFFDLEWTSWEGAMQSNFAEPWQHKEIIQIGALKVSPADGFAEVLAFNEIVIPTINPELSDYIIDLTGITQEKIRGQGVPFLEGLEMFGQFTEDWSLPSYSWGDDWTVLKQNCALNNHAVPAGLDDNMNDLREKFRAANIDIEGVNSGDLHRHFGLDLGLNAHDALDDVRSMVAVVAHLIESDSQLSEKLL